MAIVGKMSFVSPPYIYEKQTKMIKKYVIDICEKQVSNLIYN